MTLAMKRLVVIEGPDGSGKTVLARQLQDTFGFGYQHEGPPPRETPPFYYYMGRLLDVVLESLATRGVVVDRFALGERIYGPICRQEERMSEAEWVKIREAMRAINAVQVLALPPYPFALETWTLRNARKKEGITDPEVFRRTYEAWAARVNEPGMLVYDFTQAGALERVLEEVRL